MSKIYCHTPVKRILRDFLSHLDIEDKNKEDIEALNSDFSALILSPIVENKSFRQVFPLFIKKLSKKLKSLLKKQDCNKKATLNWDEGLVLNLESLEDFLSLRWQVRFHRLESCNDPEIDNFREPMVALGISDEIYVSFELLTKKQENTFEFNEVAAAINEEAEEDDGEEATELVVEELQANETEKDKEMERQKKAEEDARLEKEFQEFKSILNDKVAELEKLRSEYEFRKVLALGDQIISSLSSVKSSKREHAIYLTERKIEVSILLSTIYVSNGNAGKVIKLLQPLAAVAKKGTAEKYVELLLLLGDAYYKQEEYDEAMKAYSQTLATKKKFTQEEKMAINAKRAKTAIKFDEDDCIGYINMTAEEGIKYMKYVTETAKPGTQMYSYAAATLSDSMFKRGQIGQAAHTCLIALVADSTNEELRKLFVTFLQKHDQLVNAVLEMFTSVGGADTEESKMSTAASISFVGSILKENSAITEAEKFIRKSCDMTDFKEPEFVLAYMHLLELKRDYPTLVATALKYMKAAKKLSVSFDISKEVLSKNEDLKAALENVLADTRVKGILKEKENGDYSYNLTNSIFSEILLKSNEVINTHLSKVNLDYESSGFQSNDAVVETNILETKNAEGEEAEESIATKFFKDSKFLTIKDGDALLPLSQFVIALSNSEVANSVTYDQVVLQVLAIFFSLVKNVYQVSPLPQSKFPLANGKDAIPALIFLVEALEPIRVAGKDLHLTPVRNEQSYYSLISQLLSHKMENRFAFKEKIEKTSAFAYHKKRVEEELKKINPDYVLDKDYRTLVQDTFRRVFVFGDSHSLTLGWQLLNKKSLADDDFDVEKDLTVTELVPVLATGVKAWHLREESTFYPKHAFYQGVQFIQRYHKQFLKRQEHIFTNGNELNRTEEQYKAMLTEKPEVVLVFCEIDCREGMVLALETGRYANLEDAAEKVVEIYMTSVSKLLKKYNFKCYIHPVVPSLKETKDIVKTFNSKLEAAVKKMQFKIENSRDLVWLDFIDKLTDESGDVKEEFVLDGVHLNPTYVELFKDQILN